ncbi:MAG TPA: DUF4956 domain-containing protein [Gemmatimonadaceae bacterium]|nr:DUF4956 domain-containing protein [Gemmatimonadaceae bacterium]
MADTIEHKVPLKENVVLRAAIYYVALFSVAALLYRLPQAKEVLHGSFESLFSGSGTFDLGATKPKNAPAIAIDAMTLGLTVAASMIGAALLALPVAWIYGLTRQKRGYQQSVVQTLMILPPLVAGVVVMVKYSLALAFSLAGIIAAVRFRTTLDDSKDAVYVFLATAVGLAAAVHLPVAAVISVLFNILILALWYTDFGRAGAFQGSRAMQKLDEMEDAQERMRQTGTFVAMLDNEIFENMTPEQLDLTADRAWRRKRRLQKEDVDEEEMQRRDVLLRVRTYNPDDSRMAVEQVFDEFLKKWRLGGVVHEQDGTHVVEYAVQLKKTARSTELLDVLQSKSQVIGAEIK